jgi:hypothetical protein
MAGAPTSYGYPGSVNSAVLADWLTRAAAARFSVAGEDDWKVTVQAGLDRGIRINAGTGIGDGVMDVFPDYDTRSLPLVASGSRYYLIVARRNWSTPASTNFVVIAGTSARALPTRLDSPGQESDQPIALVRVQAGNTVVQEIVDLRAWAGNGGVEAVDIMGREPLARPGAAVKVGTNVHRYEYDPANGGSFAWKVYALHPGDVEMFTANDEFWDYAIRLGRQRSQNGLREIVTMSFFISRKGGANFTIQPDGWAQLLPPFIPAGWRPTLTTNGNGILDGPGTQFGGLGLRVQTNGAILVRSTGGPTPVAVGATINGTVSWTTV